MKNEKQIENKAREFAESILECQEYKSFMKHSRDLGKNAEAQNLLREFQQKQNELRGVGFNPSLMDALREIQLKLNQNKTIQNFTNSQNELINLLKETNDIISERIGAKFAFFQGGGCCG